MNIMTKRRQRHSPEQIVPKIQDADRILTEGGDVAAVLGQLEVTEATYYRWRN
jgi:putative transposase